MGKICVCQIFVVILQCKIEDKNHLAYIIMKKIFSLLTLVMISVMSWAAVSISVTPSHVDFGTVSLKGHEDTGVEGSVTINVNYSGLQQYCGVAFEDVEMPEDNAAFWISGTGTDGWIYGGDEWTEPEGPEFTLNFFATDPGTYTGKIRFYSYTDDYWEVESESVYLTMQLVVTSDEVIIPKTEMVRINSTGELKNGDVVAFVCEASNAVGGPLNGTYLPAVTEDLVIADGVAQVPATAQLFTASKYSGNWQFITVDSGKRLHLDITNKGAFTYEDTQAGAILANWGVSISNGAAVVSRPDDEQSFAVEFNSDRFKPYKSPQGSTIQLYKIPSGTQGIGEVTSGEKAQKILRDGQMLIIRNGMTYSVIGAKVK